VNLNDTQIQQLKNELPEYARAYEADGMAEDEYYDYGGVELFRTSFQKGWNQLLAMITKRREEQ